MRSHTIALVKTKHVFPINKANSTACFLDKLFSKAKGIIPFVFQENFVVKAHRIAQNKTMIMQYITITHL